jgi:hypothetical protein
MDKNNKLYNAVFDQDDYYLAQSRRFMDQYLAERGLTRDMLLEMPTDLAAMILKQALEAAAVQIARLEAMSRLGSRDVDTKEEPHPKRQHEDRLARHFHKNLKGHAR